MTGPVQTRLRGCTGQVDSHVRLVAVSRLRNEDLVLLYRVHQAVLIGYASRPESGHVVLQRLWLSYAIKRVTFDLLNEANDAFGEFSIMIYPVGEVIPALVSPKAYHSLCTLTWTLDIPCWLLDIENAARP
jgi:hypothetical protein